MTENEGREDSRLNCEEEEELEVPPPPDGGYGWVIVFASFMCNLVVDGIGYSFGVFLPELVKFFGQGKGTVAWIGSILAGTLLIVGPLVSALCNKFGCRAVCIAGGVISTVAFVLSTFSSSVLMMMFTYGFLGGIGFGMIYLPAVVAVGYYFDTKRSLATGIAVCGSGVGTFSFAPLAVFLLKKYGSWQNANLILAGLIFNCTVFGALMRPLTYSKKKQKPLLQRMADEKKQQMATGSVECIDEKPPKNDTSSRLSRNVSSPAFTHTPGMTSNGSVPHFEYHRKHSGTGAKLSLARKAASKHSVNYDGEQVYNSKMSVAIEPPRMVRPLSRKDIFYSGSIVNLPQYQSQKSLQNFRNSMLTLPQKDVEHAVPCACCPCLPVSVRSALGSMIDMSIAKDTAFLLIGMSNLFGMAGLYVPFVYMTDAAIINGVSVEQASLLLSVIGITNTVARIGCGWVADFPWMNSLFLNNMCLVLATVSTAVIPFCSSFMSYVAVSVAFGIAIAGYISLTSIILVDLLGLDKLTSAFGLLILFRGVAAVIGSPLAGAVYDATQSYDMSFYMAAAFFLASTICSCLAPKFRKAPEQAQPATALSPITEDQEEAEESDPLTKAPSRGNETAHRESVM